MNNGELKPDQIRSSKDPLHIALAILATASLGLEASNAMAAPLHETLQIKSPYNLPNSSDIESIIKQSENYEANPSEVVESVSVKNRVVYINGRPVFLFGVYAQNSNWGVGSLAANLFIDSGPETTPEQLSQMVQGKAWVLRQSRPTVGLDGTIEPPQPIIDPFPNEIGVAYEDEAPEHQVPVDYYAATPQDGRLAFGNFSTRLSGIAFGIQQDQKDYAPYVSALGPNAIVGDDFYPDALGLPIDVGLSRMADYIEGVKEMTGPSTPIEVFIQTANFSNNPNTGQAIQENLKWQDVLSYAKVAITKGATVINWWDRNGGGPPGATTPFLAEKIRQFSSRIHDLSPCLLGTPIEGYGSKPNNHIQMGGTTFQDEKGQEQYCIKIFNMSDRPAIIKRSLPGLANQKVVNLWSGSSVQSKNGQVTISIPPREWVILSYPKREGNTANQRTINHAVSLHKKPIKSKR